MYVCAYASTCALALFDPMSYVHSSLKNTPNLVTSVAKSFDMFMHALVVDSQCERPKIFASMKLESVPVVQTFDIYAFHLAYYHIEEHLMILNVLNVR